MLHRPLVEVLDAFERYFRRHSVCRREDVARALAKHFHDVLDLAVDFLKCAERERVGDVEAAVDAELLSDA